MQQRDHAARAAREEKPEHRHTLVLLASSDCLDRSSEENSEGCAVEGARSATATTPEHDTHAVVGVVGRDPLALLDGFVVTGVCCVAFGVQAVALEALLSGGLAVEGPCACRGGCVCGCGWRASRCRRCW